ncbi:hypothetical protein [Variovorax rhizosphaerae]|uniref:Lipoprotein n=1 Tax=Variovorax rhizosphaerae TaxID=1836200 RepID=A0ABU8WH53_9BURK
MRFCLAGALVAMPLMACLWGCASSNTEARQDVVTVALSGTGMNAGQSGRAVLVPRDDVTQVSIQVSGLSVGVTLPVHLYTYVFAGRCGNLGAKPIYDLTRNVRVTGIGGQSAMSNRGPFNLANTAPVPIAQLKGSPHALVVRTSPADASVDVFCGNL